MIGIIRGRAYPPVKRAAFPTPESNLEIRESLR
jgi:hypothetical protein